MAVTVTDILNQWDQIGVFSYVIPFLLMFAVIFAILQKTKILTGSDQENKGLLAIISISISLLALQFDLVPAFFGIIFPHFGVGLSIFLVLLILLGFFYDGSKITNEEIFGHQVQKLENLKEIQPCLLLLANQFSEDMKCDNNLKNMDTLNLWSYY